MLLVHAKRLSARSIKVRIQHPLQQRDCFGGSAAGDPKEPDPLVRSRVDAVRGDGRPGQVDDGVGLGVESGGKDDRAGDRAD